MTRRERLERKLEKQEEWAESRRAKATQAFERSRQATEGIPFGQPILVGHHSEGRHRNALKKSDNAMRRAVESMDMAKHHDSKADGIGRQLDSSIFSDDPNAIEALTAKVAELEAKREKIKATNKIIRRKPKNEPTPEKIAELAALVGSEVAARKLFEPDFCGRIGIPSYVLQNLGGNINTARKRIESIKCRNANTKVAEDAGGVAIKITENERGRYAFVIFAEKPEYSLIKKLKSAGFHWGSGGWSGDADALPSELQESAPLVRCSHPNCHVPASKPRPDGQPGQTCGNHDEDRPSDAQFVRELENEMGCEPFGPIDKD